MTNRTIAEFLSHLNRMDVQVFVEGDRDSRDEMRLRCNAPEGTLTADLRQELIERKAELLLYLSQEKVEGRRQKVGAPDNQVVGQSPAFNRSAPLRSSTPIPLSFAQQRLWFLYQLAPDNPFYNVPAAIRLQGDLDRTALERSFHEIVRRHAALRTQFATVDGSPIQIIASNVTVNLSVVNLQTVAVNERNRICQQLATAEAQRPFNLTTDSLLRLTLLQFDATESVLLLTMHHIVADGWSLGVLIRELAKCYTAFVEGRSPALPPLPIQYADFAIWQRNWLRGEVLEKQLTYWRKQLQNLPVLELPSDRPRPAVQTYRGATYPLQIPPALTQSLATLSQESGVSLFMTLLAAFQTLLYRYTGQTDLAIGSPIANRHRSELEGLIGFFVNSLVMRSNLSGNPTFRELLKQVQTVALEAYEHQDLPFEKLVEELEPDRDLSRNPLFQVAFALQNAPMQSLNLPGLTLEPAPLESGSTRFDLEVHLWEPTHGLRSLWQSQEGLSGFISYSTDLFDRDRIGRLVGHFQTLLEGIVANPDDRVADLPLLTAVERQQIVLEWNQSLLQPPNIAENISEPLCFHQLFEAQAESTPDAIALVSEQGSLTYQELNQRANQLAQTLQGLGVQPDVLIGLCVDRSAHMVIGILGILKAGGAYVPLDPAYPSDRLQFMLTDTQIGILLTQSWLVPSLPTVPAQVLCLDQPLPTKLQSSDSVSFASVNERELDSSQYASDWDNLESVVTVDNLAYVIYTSGSTGTPKGVLLSHRGLCNVVEAQRRVFHLSYGSRVLQFSSLSFDASIFEVALALGSGSTLYIPPKVIQLPEMALIQFLIDNAITHALLTPAVLAVLPSVALPDLRVLITGGETCSSQVIDRWAVGRHFFNAYGPTETTIWATVAELHPGDNPLTIGRPILNTQVYILDANLNPLPVGVPGELYIGGVGLARGYLNRPELTGEQFINVENSEVGADLRDLNSGFGSQNFKLYKTGDRAQYHADGTIEFLGRVDTQIKIRGFRVELGEIEAALQRHPAIREAVVIPVGETLDERRLCSYFSLDQHYFRQAIWQSLQSQQIQHWQTLYDQTYQVKQKAEGNGQNSQFDITGWNSSYTGESIPLEQMQEWVSDRVQQILALKPKRVLEIGCGTGLLLFQLAPYCQQYIGTDFSAVSLESIQAQLDSCKLPQVKLLHRVATDFEGIDLASFDVVILNSIVQYFPGVDYLLQVLEGAIQTVAIGGVLFIGDVRSLPLLKAFHSWMRFCQADTSMERTQLQYWVERSQFEEPELAIDPAFFEALYDRFPQIHQIQTRLSRGRSHNEMTQFRYNVLLHVNQSQPHVLTPGSLREEVTPLTDLLQPHNWTLSPLTSEAVKKHLVDTEPEIFIVTNIANARINQAIKVAHWLRHKATPKTVGRMREVLPDCIGQAIDPQDWWDLEKVLPYNVEITWSSQTEAGDYDVLLIRQGVNAGIEAVSQFYHHSANPPGLRDSTSPSEFSRTWQARRTMVTASNSFSNYANEPLQSNFARQLIPELRQSLKQTLPDYMVPSIFVPLQTLPVTSNGKVDRVSITKQFCHTLSLLEKDSSQLSNSTNTQLTTTESTLIEIWQELLRLKQITVQDNFFELGGHSLLATQMTSRVRDAFGLELPLKSVFEAPTIAQLAPILETLRGAAATPTMPPLVRLDRSAYRRKRSALLNPSPSMLQDASMIQDALVSQVLTPSPLSGQASSEPTLPESTSKPAIADRSPLIPLTLGSSKHPFFCVHPMFGVVFPYLELAHQLGSHHSFYGLQPFGLDGKSPPLNRIEAIAASYVQAIQTIQPEGPYFIGGWSFGGLVAFEMAQQLTQAGQEVGLLAILDTPAPCNKLSFYQSLRFLLGTALWSTLPFLLDYGALITNRLQSWNSWFSRRQWSAIARLIPEESRLQLLDESAIRSLLPIVYANSQAAYRYVPQPYAKRLTLFKAAEQPDSLRHESTLNWSAFAKDIQLYEVPGNHLSLLKQPHVQILAQQLGQCLSD